MRLGYLAAALMVFSVTAAHSQQIPCAPTGEYQRMATEQHGEVLRFRGMAGDGQAVLEVYVDAADGSYSVFVSTPNGVTCVPVTGQMAEFIEPAALGIDG